MAETNGLTVHGSVYACSLGRQDLGVAMALDGSFRMDTHDEQYDPRGDLMTRKKAIV
jgi:hypothetical protein